MSDAAPKTAPLSVLAEFFARVALRQIAGAIRDVLGLDVVAFVAVRVVVVDVHLLLGIPVLRQVEITANPGARNALICTDCERLLPCLAGDDAPLRQQAIDLVADIRGWLDSLGGKVGLEYVPRTATRTAYIAASQTIKAWEAGHEGRHETWCARPHDSLKAAA